MIGIIKNARDKINDLKLGISGMIISLGYYTIHIDSREYGFRHYSVPISNLKCEVTNSITGQEINKQFTTMNSMVEYLYSLVTPAMAYDECLMDIERFKSLGDGWNFGEGHALTKDTAKLLKSTAKKILQKRLLRRVFAQG